MSHACTLEVRGYELDGFGHVNHAVYVNYFEFARWKALQSVGVHHQDLEKWQVWPVIAEIQLQYLGPAFAGEILTVKSEITEVSRAQFRVRQSLYKGEKEITRAQIRAVTVGPDGRPKAMPDSLHSALLALTQEADRQ